MENNKTITIKDETGKDVKLEIIEELIVEGKNYAIVSPIGSEEAYAYRTEDKNGMREYISIGLGEEFEKVLEAFNAIIEED